MEKIYKSEFKETDLRKAKSNILKEATFTVNNIDSAIDTIADCVQWIMVKKNLNIALCSELISKGIVTGLDTLSSAVMGPEEAIKSRAQKTANRIAKNTMAFSTGRKTSEDF